jgi:hypothetical protein
MIVVTIITFRRMSRHYFFSLAATTNQLSRVPSYGNHGKYVSGRQSLTLTVLVEKIKRKNAVIFLTPFQIYNSFYLFITSLTNPPYSINLEKIKKKRCAFVYYHIYFTYDFYFIFI